MFTEGTRTLHSRRLFLLNPLSSPSSSLETPFLPSSHSQTFFCIFSFSLPKSDLDNHSSQLFARKLPPFPPCSASPLSFVLFTPQSFVPYLLSLSLSFGFLSLACPLHTFFLTLATYPHSLYLFDTLQPPLGRVNRFFFSRKGLQKSKQMKK